MFLLAIILSFTGYAVQGTLMAKYAREMDGLSTVVYRSGSLIFTMLPLLFFASWAEICGISDYWLEISLAGITAVVGSALSFYSMKFMSIGIKNVFSKMIGTIWAIILGFLFFHETITLAQGILMFFVLVSGYMLSREKNDFEHLDNNIWKGLVLTFLSQIIVGVSFYYVSYVSRELSPYVAGYFWEALIGIFAIIIVIFRPLYDGKKLHKISLSEFWKIAAICSLTLFGTGGFLYAVNIGSYAVTNVLMNGSIFVSILVAHYAFHEKMTKQQWIWIVALVAGIVALNYALEISEFILSLV
jgi:drug/metabolite transporter (DMT)-like permease